MSEDRLWVRDTHVARECQVESATHAITVHGRADRCRKVVNGTHEALSHEREVEGVGGEGGDFVEVGSGGKELVVAGDDEWLRCFGQFLNRNR